MEEEWQRRTASQSLVGALPLQRVWQPVRSPMHQEAAGKVSQSIGNMACVDDGNSPASWGLTEVGSM